MCADTSICCLDDVGVAYLCVFIHMSVCVFVCDECVCIWMDGEILFVFFSLVVVALLPSCLVALIVFLLVDKKTIGKEDKKKKIRKKKKKVNI